MNALSGLLSIVAVLIVFTAQADNSAVVAGWAESVTIDKQGIGVLAKLDTGAQNSSLNGRHIEVIDRAGQSMVRFDIQDRDGRRHSLELPLVRYATIKRHFGNSQTRPVVMLSVCLANHSKTIEVNLVDRSGFDYPMLLGRSFLAPDFLVDSSRKNITRPTCPVKD